MKRIVSFALALLMLVSVLTGCGSKLSDENKGAQITVYFSSVPYDLDPQTISYDSDLLQYIGMLFEGLTTIDAKGNVKPALAKEWEYEIDTRDDCLKLYFTLNESQWSDGIPVDADDVVYAWRRLLLPETNSYAASLLYPIKNAKAVKSGLMTIDDLGIYAVNEKTLEVVFEKEFTDVESFLRTVASPALVPLRSDVAKTEDWARPIYIKLQDDPDAMSTIITNGPFFVKSFTKEFLILERCVYYRALKDGQALDKYVTPYQIVITANQSLEEQEYLYENDKLFFLSDFSKDTYSSYKRMKTDEELSTYSFFFNTNNEVLKDAKVRNALSMALDRNEIAAIVGKGVKAATGFVPAGIYEGTKSGDFRKAGGELISTSAKLDEAKALLKEANFKGGELTIACRTDNEADVAVAEYVKGVWNKLGLTVTIKKYQTKPYALSSDKKNFYDVLKDGDFDVIGFDYIALTDDAYSFLVPFAKEYSGSVVSISDDAEPFTPHITGFVNDEYDALISGILSAANAKERAEIYHAAEKLLLEEMPVTPLYFNTDSYVSKDLSKFTVNRFGQVDFTKAKLKNYEDKKYQTSQE